MSFETYIKYLKNASLLLVVFSCFWAIYGSFDPFGIYDHAFANAFWNNDQLSEDVIRTKRFLLGPLGATSAAYFLLQFFIVKHALAKKEIWAYEALCYGFILWFLIDSLVCLYHGALFNVLLANLPCLILMLPLFFMKKHFRR